MQWKTIKATVMRKGNNRGVGGRCLIVRSSALVTDKVVSVLPADYHHRDAARS